jgi:hypothetical protein
MNNMELEFPIGSVKIVNIVEEVEKTLKKQFNIDSY